VVPIDAAMTTSPYLRLPSALAKASVALTLGLVVAAAGAIGPELALNKMAERRFDQGAAKGATTLLTGLERQLNGMTVLADDFANGVDSATATDKIRAQGWTPSSLLGEVGVVEHVDFSQIQMTSEQMSTVGTSPDPLAPADSFDTVVRTFSADGQMNFSLGSTQETALAKLGLSELPAPGDEKLRLISGSASELLNARLVTPNGLGGDAETSVGNERIVVAVPLAGRGWLVSIVQPILPKSNGIGFVLRAGSADTKSLIAWGSDVPTGRTRTKSSAITTADGATEFEVVATGPWRYQTPAATNPLLIGSVLGALSVLLAAFIGMRQHRRNVRAMTDVITAGRAEARTDALTELANRLALTEVLAEPASTGGRAVLMADLDRFKIVNDSRGHEAGDRLLIAVAGRLKEIATAEPGVRCVARFGGDEFVLVIDGPDVAEAAVGLGDKILSALRTPFQLGSDAVVIGASLGLAVADSSAANRSSDTATSDTATSDTATSDAARRVPTSFESILRDADIAMYAAKRAGGNQVCVADETLRTASSQQLDLEIAIREALAQGQFEPYFQPLVDQLGTIRSFEALIRWRRPDGSLMSPGQFLPAAKNAGLLGEVSTSVLASVAPIVSAWNHRRIAEGSEPVCVHVNCVEEQLCDLGFPDVVGSLLAHNSVDPSWIMLEISEETALEKIPRGMPTLQYLWSLGVKFSLDDFGFGNSSLTMLRELGEVAELKLDKSIVDDIAVEGIGADADVVDAILGFAKRRNITIVAEGIEQQEQWSALRNLGVHLFQGYLFSKPVPAYQAEALLFPEDSRSDARVDDPAMARLAVALSSATN
jgi:diguanylate cyclase (GGDEF)-like protein